MEGLFEGKTMSVELILDSGSYDGKIMIYCQYKIY